MSSIQGSIRYTYTEDFAMVQAGCAAGGGWPVSGAELHYHEIQKMDVATGEAFVSICSVAPDTHVEESEALLCCSRCECNCCVHVAL